MNFEKVAIFDGVTVVNKALIDHLQDGILESLERVDGAIVPNALLIGSKSGKIKSSKYTIEDIFKNGSVGLEGDVIPNSLVIANKNGKLECANINFEDVVVRDSIITGAKSEYVEVLEDNVTAVEIPNTIKEYPHISVYQNGKLLIEGMHFSFTESGDVEMLEASAYKNDVFSFVGYGSTTQKARSGDSGGGYIPPNKDVLESITQERVDAWDTITTHNHDEAYLLPNKLIVEKITQDDIDAWNTITTHDHDDKYFLPNKGILTSITQENVDAWNRVVENESQHIFQNKEVLEKITQEQVDSWDTITTHNHDEAYLLPNKLIIEGITQDDIDTWNTVTTHDHDDRYLTKEEVLVSESGTFVPSLLPTATEETRGAVLSSSEINSVSVAEDGTMQVNKMDVTNLVTSTQISDAEGEDYGIILGSGTANSYKD